ncbi:MULTISPECIES: hypothetical protein [Streptomyces]|uniref:hypothetical protein n=1 Tax=Streptomyces TaxID=1883 RepID=UPI00039AFCE0|nr:MULTISPECIES: hypothetical protein [Streptomyces]MBZ6110956.1 hypothetical protein [Streptomyces olivaceus]MBZ6126323.1 hypothetical protein [Streptomyces olivaceus]MBZ6145293.1 hypothetical protein [Streptomyces olivaceus]MBZ6159701.1 hypothetical protein [Streptomyces olivaceus]MBZ6187480.1 hypothetical protein [Streptomyces olivaceus]
MVSSSHEAMHRIFQDYPTLFTRVSETLGLPFPSPTAVTALPNDVTETKAVDRRIDTLLRIDTESHGPFLLAVEAQKKKDPEKSASWGYYLAYLRSKYRLPPLLLVICQDRATAEWAARPDPIGFCSWPSLTVRPLVAGPGNMPVISDPAEAVDDLALATLSTIVHGASPDIEGILKTMSTALREVPDDVRNPVVEFIFQGLDKLPAADIWRKLVVVDLSFYKSSFFQEVRAEVIAEATTAQAAEDVLAVLDMRGVDVPEEARARITGCDDPDVLRGWLRQAVVATSIDDVFRTE